MGRRTTLAWLIAVIAGVFMVLPALASAQEQGSTEGSQLTDEVEAEDTSTGDPATETPPADPPADPVEPADPVDPDPVEETEPPAVVEPTEPAEDASYEASADTSKASEPAATSEPAPAPAPAPAAAPAPEPAAVAVAQAKATSSAGNGSGGDTGAATRRVSGGGDQVQATIKSGKSKPGCLARGGANEVHNTFPNDGSCAQSLFNNGSGLSNASDGVSDLLLAGISFDIWLTGGNTVNFTVLSGGPFTGAFYVKGGPPHNTCLFTNVADGAGGSCSTALNPNSQKLYDFSHLDICVGDNPPPPPPPDGDTPPNGDTPGQPGVPGQPEEQQEVLQEQQQEQREQEREEREQLEELEEVTPVPPTAVPAAVTPAPEEALPFTGLDAGWLVVLGLAMLGCGALLRRQVS